MEENKSIRNSEIWVEYLKRKGITLKDILNRFHEHGITRFDKYFSEDGNSFIEIENECYTGSRCYHASDSGKRTQSQTELDCVVGNMQEALFCIDNPDFTGNKYATNESTTSDIDITTNEDLIHIPTKNKVEYKTCFAKQLYGNYAYYNHRNGGFRKFIMDGGIMIIHFIELDKLVIIYDGNFEQKDYGPVKIKKEHEYSKGTNKYWDTVIIYKSIMFDYKYYQGNYEISQTVTDIINNRNNK